MGFSKLWNSFRLWVGGWGYRVARTLIAEEAEALYDIALSAVVNVSWLEVATGEEKFSDACAQVIAIAVKEEIEHGTAAVRKAIEDMHAVVKAEKLGAYGAS